MTLGGGAAGIGMGTPLFKARMSAYFGERPVAREDRVATSGIGGCGRLWGQYRAGNDHRSSESRNSTSAQISNEAGQH